MEIDKIFKQTERINSNLWNTYTSRLFLFLLCKWTKLTKWAKGIYIIGIHHHLFEEFDKKYYKN